KKRASPKTVLVGIDEVGRGPLAGPITVGAVAFVASDKCGVNSGRLLRGIKDSKKLSPARRQEWFKKIRGDRRFIVTHISVSHAIIDRRGLSYAARYAVKQCLEKITEHLSLPTQYFYVLLDAGLYAPSEYRQERFVKGDERIPLIAAASIIAKVTRDKHMIQMHKKYPTYGFVNHKGYGTRAHIAVIRKHGMSEIHRKTFCTRII
ncbi:MAG: ribonuclease HII, partial [Patescibacteria group bacterium]